MKIFGSQIEHVTNVLKAKQRPMDLGASKDKQNQRLKLSKEYSKVIMQILVSLVVLIGSFYILFNYKENPDLQKTAAGVVGTIIGYWLK
jgi:hypothetical protein